MDLVIQIVAMVSSIIIQILNANYVTILIVNHATIVENVVIVSKEPL